MKTIFQALAKYNASVNQSLAELLGPLPKEKLMAKTKAFFPSVFDTLVHNLMADLAWIKRYGAVFKDSKALRDSGLGQLEEAGMDPAKLFDSLKKVGDVTVRFIDELDDAALARVIRYKNYKGEDTEKEMWKTLLHWFNHQTHHRGAVSVLLELQDVPNDFSNLMPRI